MIKPNVKRLLISQGPQGAKGGTGPPGSNGQPVGGKTDYQFQRLLLDVFRSAVLGLCDAQSIQPNNRLVLLFNLHYFGKADFHGWRKRL